MSEATIRVPARYRTTELGLLPEEWQVVELRDLFEIQQGKALSPKSRSGKSPRPFLRTANVLWGHLDLRNVDQMDFTEEEVRRLALVQNDLLVCEGGDIGRTAIWEGHIDNCCYQNHIHRLRTKNENVEAKFYMFWMQTALLILNLYGGEGNKTTIPNLSKTRLGRFVVPFPPFQEQKAIAHALKAMQEAKEKTEEVIRATKELKKSMMRHLFTYGPVSSEEAEKVKLKETEIGAIPEEWNVKILQDAVDSIEYGYSISIPSSESPKGISIISTADITREGKILYGNIRRIIPPKRLKEQLIVKNGDILFNWRNSPELIGKTAIFQEQLQPHIYASFILRIRCNQNVSYNAYLCYLLNYYREKGIFLKLSRRAVNQANYNRNEISVLKVPLPPVVIQRQISDILSVIDSKIEAEENKKNALEGLFKTLLHDLMTAKIRVNNLPLEA
jgi:type I restriction enzyme S subunit